MKTSNGTVGGLKTPIIISDTTRVHCSAFQIQQQRKPSRPTMDHSQPSPRIQHYQAIGTLLVHNPVTTLSTTYRVASSNLIVAMTITTQVDGGSRCLLLLLLICWIHTRLNPNKEANQHSTRSLSSHSQTPASTSPPEHQHLRHTQNTSIPVILDH